MSLLPQALISNFSNRVTGGQESNNQRDHNHDPDLIGPPLLTIVQTTRSHKRGKVINYSEDLMLSDIIMEEDDDVDDDDNNNNTNTLNISTLNNHNENDSYLDDETAHSNNTNLKRTYPPFPDLDIPVDNTNFLKFAKIRETFRKGKYFEPYSTVVDFSKFDPKNNNSIYNKSIDAQYTADKTDVNDSTTVNKESNCNSSALVPIKLDFETAQGYKINDFFTWNLNDPLTPEDFVKIYLIDLGVSPSSSITVFNTLYNTILKSIESQLQEYGPLAHVVLPEIHVVVNLTCHIGQSFFEDNFQWNLGGSTETGTDVHGVYKDIPSSSITPEQYAEIVVSDLGLQREFVGLISFSLHEVILKLKKRILEGGINEINSHLYNGAAFGYVAGVRLDVNGLGNSWCPKVEVLTEWEMEKREIEKERNYRRLSRRRKMVDELETSLRI
ncbi:related to Chromatin structure-remodeling complex subunit SFH1 [Saccharomycodes ludwigii]|uniref:Related to Chromatin structure-remodeling complex subunit SFH1 n=1 Tax=Saccharomycodes ludwigii TaxID=36035 RepID=A0A376B3F4_9ASCO|nr:hypothetical protein SCDLUD_004877 [Saccharomycodes ludwigii]KAH3899434.1 hypothetical protein SCDLUD_004877 [Saccharomycodes ludwigii]SSD59004.1 related to Chromatin structure-remodeling complex subunit SFH1 [Saccharomycodes ludwigii]